MLLSVECCHYSMFRNFFMSLEMRFLTYHIFCLSTHLSTIYMPLLVFTLSDGSRGTCLSLCWQREYEVMLRFSVRKSHFIGVRGADSYYTSHKTVLCSDFAHSYNLRVKEAL